MAVACHINNHRWQDHPLALGTNHLIHTQAILVPNGMWLPPLWAARSPFTEVISRLIEDWTKSLQFIIRQVSSTGMVDIVYENGIVCVVGARICILQDFVLDTTEGDGPQGPGEGLPSTSKEHHLRTIGKGVQLRRHVALVAIRHQHSLLQQPPPGASRDNY